MPDLDVVVPALAPVDAPVIATAVDAAVASKDVSAFLEARHAERSGKPLELPTDTTAAPAQPEADTPALSRKQREQQLTNDRIRDAVSRAVAEKDAEIARLRGTNPTPTPAPKEAAPAPAKFDSWDVWSEKNKDASYDDYIDARADHRFEQRHAAVTREQEQRTRAQQSETLQQTFLQRAAKAVEADPEVLTHLAPGLLNALIPTSAVPDGQPITVHNVIADHVMKSDVGLQLLTHFTDHPDDYAALATLPPADFYLRMGKLEVALEKGTPKPPDPKPVSKMTPPPVTLGSRAADPTDPIDAAVASGDIHSFLAARERQRAAQRL